MGEAAPTRTSAKNSLRDASHERPGVYAIDEAGHVFIAEGGDEYNGAKCWVVADTTNDVPLTEAASIAGQYETIRDQVVAADPRCQDSCRLSDFS